MLLIYNFLWRVSAVPSDTPRQATKYCKGPPDILPEDPRLQLTSGQGVVRSWFQKPMGVERIARALLILFYLFPFIFCFYFPSLFSCLSVRVSGFITSVFPHVIFSVLLYFGSVFLSFLGITGFYFVLFLSVCGFFFFLLSFCSFFHFLFFPLFFLSWWCGSAKNQQNNVRACVRTLRWSNSNVTQRIDDQISWISWIRKLFTRPFLCCQCV